MNCLKNLQTLQMEAIAWSKNTNESKSKTNQREEIKTECKIATHVWKLIGKGGDGDNR